MIASLSLRHTTVVVAPETPLHCTVLNHACVASDGRVRCKVRTRDAFSGRLEKPRKCDRCMPTMASWREQRHEWFLLKMPMTDRHSCRVSPRGRHANMRAVSRFGVLFGSGANPAFEASQQSSTAVAREQRRCVEARSSSMFRAPLPWTSRVETTFDFSSCQHFSRHRQVAEKAARGHDRWSCSSPFRGIFAVTLSFEASAVVRSSSAGTNTQCLSRAQCPPTGLRRPLRGAGRPRA